MKKMIVALLLITIVISFIGCGKENTGKYKKDNGDTDKASGDVLEESSEDIDLEDTDFESPGLEENELEGTNLEETEEVSSNEVVTTNINEEKDNQILESPYIGLKHKNDGNLPDGLVDNGGWLYEFINLMDDTYICAIVSKGNEQMIWLEKVTKREENGSPAEVEVLDVLTLPKNNHELTTYLIKDGQHLEGFGVVRYTDTEYFEDFYQAWRINPANEKFEEISTEGLKGVNEGYGV